jgi:hypothetical protein
MLILSDVNGIPIACSEPIAGNHKRVLSNFRKLR